MKKSEQKAQTQFNHWVKEIFLPKHRVAAFAFELKDLRGRNALPFSDVKDHQVAALQAVHGKGMVYKISDSAMGQKPFDSIAFKGCPAYVVIKYPKSFELIAIEVWVKESKESKRRSLTHSRAKELSTYSVNI